MGYMTPDPVLPLVRRVLDFIIDNPGCTAPQIALHFGVSIQSANQATRRLRANGLIRRIPGRRKWGMQYEAGDDDQGTDIVVRASVAMPKQSSVSEWEPVKVKPQTWWSGLTG